VDLICQRASLLPYLFRALRNIVSNARRQLDLPPRNKNSGVRAGNRSTSWPDTPSTDGLQNLSPLPHPLAPGLHKFMHELGGEREACPDRRHCRRVASWGNMASGRSAAAVSFLCRGLFHLCIDWRQGHPLESPFVPLNVVPTGCGGESGSSDVQCASGGSVVGSVDVGSGR
jgi:hypothetical protein